MHGRGAGTRRALLAGSAGLALAGLAWAAPPVKVDPAHEKAVLDWRAHRASRLRADDGWLTVAGLFWLEPGKNTVGSDEKHRVLLPAHSSPKLAGVLELAAGKVTLNAAPGVAMTVDGQPVTQRELRSDRAGKPDVVTLGDLRFFVIDRDGRIGVRLRDLRSKARSDFHGLEYFPVRPEYRVTAKVVPHGGPATKIPKIKIPTVMGTTTEMVSAGKLVFTLAGKSLSLDAVLEEPEDKSLFVIFRDGTAGKETYGAGRFVYTEGLPKDGTVVIDFNKAYSPPCALTAFATCPLPPSQNRLPIRIEAGEKKPPGAH